MVNLSYGLDGRITLELVIISSSLCPDHLTKLVYLVTKFILAPTVFIICFLFFLYKIASYSNLPLDVTFILSTFAAFRSTLRNIAPYLLITANAASLTSLSLKSNSRTRLCKTYNRRSCNVILKSFFYCTCFHILVQVTHISLIGTYEFSSCLLNVGVCDAATLRHEVKQSIFDVCWQCLQVVFIIRQVLQDHQHTAANIYQHQSFA
jgi:hypothetical protein